MAIRVLVLIGLLLSVGSPLAAAPQTGAAEPGSPGAQLDSMVQGVLEALGAIMRSIPQYEMPEVLPNGDIIIRRIRPDEPPPPQPAPEPQSPDNDGVRT